MCKLEDCWIAKWHYGNDTMAMAIVLPVLAPDKCRTIYCNGSNIITQVGAFSIQPVRPQRDSD